MSPVDSEETNSNVRGKSLSSCWFCWLSWLCVVWEVGERKRKRRRRRRRGEEEGAMVGLKKISFFFSNLSLSKYGRRVKQLFSEGCGFDSLKTILMIIFFFIFIFFDKPYKSFYKRMRKTSILRFKFSSFSFSLVRKWDFQNQNLIVGRQEP